jgi:hypothetical protein
MYICMYVGMYVGFKTFFYAVRRLDSTSSYLPTGVLMDCEINEKFPLNSQGEAQNE